MRDVETNTAEVDRGNAQRTATYGDPTRREAETVDSGDEALATPGLQRAAERAAGVAAATSSAARPLEAGVRSQMETSFGADFGDVRIHTGRAAADSARQLQAAAYTTDRHIVFGEGRFAPQTPRGRHLLAHELAHVVQQRSGPVAASDTGTGIALSDPSDRFERAAEETARDIATRPPQAPGEIAGRSTPCSAMVLALQRTAGNMAVARWATSDFSARPTAATIVQRQGDAGVSDAGVGDAGESLPGGVPPTHQELEDQRLNQMAPDALSDEDLGPALEAAERQGNTQRYDQLLEQLRLREPRSSGFGVGMPVAMPRGVGGNALVTPQQALSMLENMLAGRPPFRPELGVGGASWFVTEGSPYTGVGPEHTVPVQAELINTQNALRYDQAALERIFYEERARALPEVEAQVREQFRVRTGRDPATPLSRTLSDKVARQLRGLAERRMWERIGAEVRASSLQVGEVILPGGGVETPGGPPVFSRTPGRFKVVADAARIRIRGGPMPLLRALEGAGAGARVAPLEASVAELTRTMRLAGRVRTVLRVAGKILIVVAIAVDLFEIIVAEDTLEATIVSLAGWGGAAAAAAGFSALWTPADVAGPWAWVGHGVGMLVSGAVGYWVGSETTRYVYRLTVRSRGQIRGAH